jgi:hypothetical protein
MVDADEADLWPDVSDPLAARVRPKELGSVFPHRWAIPRETWIRFFGSAEREIGVLAYGALFIAEDAGILQHLAAKALQGVRVRIALGDPDSRQVAERGEEEGIGEAMSAKIRNALTLYRPLVGVPNVEIRLHHAALYNSIYRADSQLLVNQHTYGIPAANSPVFVMNGAEVGEMGNAYFTSFERIWDSASSRRSLASLGRDRRCTGRVARDPFRSSRRPRSCHKVLVRTVVQTSCHKLINY